MSDEDEASEGHKFAPVRAPRESPVPFIGGAALAVFAVARFYQGAPLKDVAVITAVALALVALGVWRRTRASST
jgi:CDP-diglyceride synthetase